MKEGLKEELEGRASGGRLACAEARGIAEAMGIAYAEVGRAADELGIKITSCELGCF